MLRLICSIIITQQPTTAYQNRANVYTLNFVNDCEINSTWKNLTMTAKLIIPRNIYVKTDQGLVNWIDQSSYVPIEGNDTPPILLRGDRISISLGYFGYQMNEEFNGYISTINPKKPMELECEDNMWLLKQALCPNMVFDATKSTATYKDTKGGSHTITSHDKQKWTAQSIVKALLSISSVATNNTYLNNVLLPQLAQINVINGFGATANITTNLGTFRTQNETIAQVLHRFQKDYKLECFFRKNIASGAWTDLYCSGVVYNPDDYLSGSEFKTIDFNFQQNVVDNQMQYLRKDDVRLGIRAYSVSKYELAALNSAGQKTTKATRLTANVGDQDGEIRTMYFWPKYPTDPDLSATNLTELATQMLQRLKYEGWRGQFTSFGIPYIQHGQAVKLSSTVNTDNPAIGGVSEMQGVYLVKSVKTRFGQNGFRRTIEPHIRLDGNNGIDYTSGL